MEFLSTDSFPVNNNSLSLRKLLADNHKISLVLSHPSFEDELRSQPDFFINYFAQPTIIKELIANISLNDFESHSKSTPLQCLNSFCVLSLCNPKITFVLFSSSHLLNSFFAILSLNNRVHSTSQGYFLGICRNLMSEHGIQRQIFLAAFENQKKKTLYAMVENLTISNASLIKLLLAEHSGLSQTTRYQIFNYLIFYFMNSKFEENKKVDFDELNFENLFLVFRFLISEKLNFEYKTKYIENLLNEKTISSKKYFVQLFTFRVIILQYISQMNQIKKIDHAAGFLKKAVEISGKFRKNALLLDTLFVFENLSRNKEFENEFGTNFVEHLIEILLAREKSDVIHKKVFCIFDNLLTYDFKKSKSLNYLIQKMLELTKGVSANSESAKLGKLSQHFIAKLFERIEPSWLSSDLKKEFATAKVKLALGLKKFEVISFNLSGLDNQSQAIQLLKSTDDIQKFLNGMEAENNYANEKNIFITGEEVLQQKYKSSNNVFERDQQATHDLHNLLASQDFQPTFANTSKEEVDETTDFGICQGLGNQLFSPKNSQLVRQSPF